MRDFFIELTDLTQTDVLNFCILHSVSFSSGNVRDFITVWYFKWELVIAAKTKLHEDWGVGYLNNF